MPISFQRAEQTYSKMVEEADLPPKAALRGGFHVSRLRSGLAVGGHQPSHRVVADATIFIYLRRQNDVSVQNGIVRIERGNR